MVLYVVKQKCTTANVVIYSDISLFYYQKFFLLSLCKYIFLLIILTKTQNLIGGQVVHFCLNTYMSLFLFQFEYMNVAMIHFSLHFHVKVAFVNAHAFYIVAISTSEVDVVFLDHFMCPQINNANSHSV